jgi:hypothetical protein
MDIEIKHLQFKHPFTCLIAGPNGSGKTHLVRNILNSFNVLFYNVNTPVLKVLWSYGQWQPLINFYISDSVIVKTNEGIPSEKIINEFKPNIIVLDDLLTEFEKQKNKNVENLFIKKSHHLNISVIFVVQNLFYKSIRTISLNSHYIIVLKNPRDPNQVWNLAKQIFPNNSKILTEAFKDATKTPYGYLLIDLTPDTPEKYRLRTRITTSEVISIGRNFAPIIYYLKD